MESLDNSKVSSEIFYRCQPGLSLEGRITSVCDENGRWSPDPSQLACTTMSAGICNVKFRDWIGLTENV